jgi:hypothetical protein
MAHDHPKELHNELVAAGVKCDFREAAKSRQLILAGRMSEPGDKTFGIATLRRPMETQRESSCKENAN